MRESVSNATAEGGRAMIVRKVSSSRHAISRRSEVSIRWLQQMALARLADKVLSEQSVIKRSVKRENKQPKQTAELVGDAYGSALSGHGASKYRRQTAASNKTEASTPNRTAKL